jgi:hypothetical protein
MKTVAARRSFSLVYLVATLGMLMAYASESIAQSPRLGISGSQFTVNGSPRYLLFVSYFDAMRASAGDLDYDLKYLKNLGYDGIRIFPNWFHYRCDGSVGAGSDALFTTGSSVNPSRWGTFLSVLTAAGNHGLLVDSSFTREITFEDYKQQFRDVTIRLRGSHPHVFFDLHNEYPNGNQLTPAQVAEIARMIHTEDPARLVTVSTGENDEASAGQVAHDAGLNLAAPHTARNLSNWWAAGTLRAVNRTSDGLDGTIDGRFGAPDRPVYLQEPMPFSQFVQSGTGQRCGTLYDRTLGHARSAARAGKASGAAAATFHTRTTFDLSRGGYWFRLDSDPEQQTELEAVKPFVGLFPNEWIASADGQYRLTYQGDANLVLVGPDGVPVWASHTVHGNAGHARLRSDGNFVLFDGNGGAYWNTSTADPEASLVVQSGRIVIKQASGAILYSSADGGPGSLGGDSRIYKRQVVNSPDGRFHLVYQADGNLVLYREDWVAVWASNTVNPSASPFAIFQSDGNLVLYQSNGDAYWNTGTWGNPGARLAVQDDGNVVIYRADGSAAWDRLGFSHP